MLYILENSSTDDEASDQETLRILKRDPEKRKKQIQKEKKEQQKREVRQKQEREVQHKKEWEEYKKRKRDEERLKSEQKFQTEIRIKSKKLATLLKRGQSDWGANYHLTFHEFGKSRQLYANIFCEPNLNTYSVYNEDLVRACTERVSVEVLKLLRHIDRYQEETEKFGREKVNEVYQKMHITMLNHGQTPVIVAYDPIEKTAYLYEGNHRLSIAILYNMTHLWTYVLNWPAASTPHCKIIHGPEKTKKYYKPSEIGIQ